MRDKNTGKVDLQGFRVAILVTDGFEQVELEDPREALQEADAETVAASPKTGTVQGMNHDERAIRLKWTPQSARWKPKTSTQFFCLEAL